jgi:putative ABC transport system permease protein
VIGVIKNYHQRSLQNAHEPIVFVPNFFSQYNLGWNKFYYFVRFRPDTELSDIPHVITEIETAWKSTSSDRTLSYFFLESYFESYYKSETTFGSLFLFFSCLAVFIACLGLFGVVSYTTLQRTKEIGIRKVLGATVQNILMLLCKDFALLILMATCFAIPTVAFMLSNWLESYAFRITLDIGLFSYPVFLVFSLALLTVMLKSLGVATLNPVSNLRSE